MKAGDLIIFRNCAQQGKIGIISTLCERSLLAKRNPELAIYWVIFDAREECFTGKQLVAV